MANEYSRRWFGSFLETIPEDWTAAEVAGISHCLPLPEFRRVLDICCGPGRHARRLADLGYEITGVDRDAEAIEEAARRVPTASFRVADQRDLRSITTVFDAAVILWQSFGYFDPATNDRVLADVAGLLRRGGRLLLDLYHPGFVEGHTAAQTDVRAPDCASITNNIDDHRLVSQITYDDGTIETMDFELFDPDDLATRAARVGLSVIGQCSWWDSTRPPSREDQRYQLVLERQ